MYYSYKSSSVSNAGRCTMFLRGNTVLFAVPYQNQDYIIIPDNVTEIGIEAFLDRSSITHIRYSPITATNSMLYSKSRQLFVYAFN